MKMYGTNNIKFVIARQAKEVYQDNKECTFVGTRFYILAVMSVIRNVETRDDGSGTTLKPLINFSASPIRTPCRLFHLRFPLYI
jgi:hypothetical protein